MYYMNSKISIGLKPSSKLSGIIQTLEVEALKRIYPKYSTDLQLGVSPSQCLVCVHVISRTRTEQKC